MECPIMGGVAFVFFNLPLTLQEVKLPQKERIVSQPLALGGLWIRKTMENEQ